MVSASAIAAQIAFTRLFSITLWHHFAYLVVGLALLGFGIAGAWLATHPSSASELRLVLAKRCTYGAAASLLALLVALSVRCNPLELLRSPSAGFTLALIVSLVTIPFLAAGLVIGTALSGFAGRAGSVYAADLIGGGIAGALCALLLPSLGGLGVLLACVLLLGAAGVLFALSTPHLRTSIATVVALTLVGVAIFQDEDAWVVPAPTKELGLYHRPEIGQRVVEHRVWTAHGRIDVGREFRAPPFVAGEVNVGAGRWRSHPMTQDGAAPTAIHAVDEDPAELTFLPNSSTAAIWALRGATFARRSEQADGGPEVLVIGVGGGIDVTMALAFGASHVTGAEINPGILSLLTGKYGRYAGKLAQRPEVDLIQSEGRAFVRGTDRTFDVIQLAGVDTFTALSSGAYSVAEAYVYTAEAFEDYFAHLRPGGCVSVSRLILQPPRETLRLAVTATTVLEARGVENPSRHVAVLRAKKWATLLACESPIPDEGLQRLRDFAKRAGFSLAFDPGDPKDDPFGHALAGSRDERAAYVSAYPYRVAPATDESPFFFNYYRWSHLAAVPQLASTELVYGTTVPIGHAVLLLTLLVTAVAAAIGVLRPLRGSAGRARWVHGLYFAALGVGYLLIEIAFIQRLTFFLGHPTRAMTVVLSALLVSSGIGAALSRRIGASNRSSVALWLVPVGAIAVAAASFWLLPRWVGMGYSARVVVSLALVAPLGVLMGIPFPLGLERLRSRGDALVPWAFGVNAFFTVIAAAVAPLMALETGLSALLVAAACAYAVVGVAWRRWPSNE